MNRDIRSRLDQWPLEKWKRLSRIVCIPLVPVLAFLVIFGFPLLGNLAFFLVSDFLTDGCRTTSEGFPVNCFRYGLDMGDLVRGYGLGMFLLGIINPMLAYGIVTHFIPVYILVPWIVLAWYLRRRVKEGVALEKSRGSANP